VGSAIKPVGWSQRLAERVAEDERLLQEFADNGGRGRDRREVEQARAWVQHVRNDIGPNGVITAIEVNPDGVVAWFYIEPDPEEAAAGEKTAARSALPAPAQLMSSWPASASYSGVAPRHSSAESTAVQQSAAGSGMPQSP
jgi:hypothetical protein